jgi:tetratricopeptide (TPR) repeat protein
VLRLVGYFVVVFVALHFLRLIPGLGAVFGIPFVGFMLAAVIVSSAVAWFTTRAVDGRRYRALERQLGAVDTPHNQGKLGALLLAQRRNAEAIPHLERAARGEPERVEWSYRLGCALLGARRYTDAVVELERTASVDEEHAYGAVLMRLSQAQLSLGRAADALATLERFERNHGPSPESAYRRGCARRALAQRSEARAAFAEVGKLATHAARFQRSRARSFALRAFFARLV